MLKLTAILVVTLAACGGGKKDTNTAGTPTTGTGMAGQEGIDPTVPSWAPDSCKTYQKAVFQAVNCEPMEKGKRDEIRASYDSASASWKAEQNADAARIEEVNKSCTSSAESVRSAIGDLCVPPAQ